MPSGELQKKKKKKSKKWLQEPQVLNRHRGAVPVLVQHSTGRVRPVSGPKKREKKQEQARTLNTLLVIYRDTYHMMEREHE